MPQLKRRKIGKIYRIINNVDDVGFISSTFQNLSGRMAQHRASARKGSKNPLHVHMREVGIKHFKIILIETLHDINKEELRRREDYWIENLNDAEQE